MRLCLMRGPKVRAHMQAKQQRGGSLRLGSPAPAPCGANCKGPPSPIDWLTEFYAACNQARRLASSSSVA